MGITEVVAVVGLFILLVGNVVTMALYRRNEDKLHGHLEEKVENLKETIDGSNQRVGLVEKVDGISRHLTALESECHTMFPIIENKLDLLNGKGKESNTKAKSSRKKKPV